jgi:HlyD family secretion protein
MAGHTRSRAGKVGVRVLITLGVLAAVGGTAWAIWGIRERQAAAAAEATPAPPAPTFGVGALGRLEPGWKVYQVAPPSSTDGSRVEALKVEEGDEVRAGDVLAVLDMHQRRRAAVAEAKAQVLVAQAKLAQVKAGSKPDEVVAQDAAVAKLKASLRYAEVAFKRMEGLRASRAASDDEYEQRKAEVDANRELLRQAEATLAAIKTVRPEDVAAAEAEVAKAEAGVVRADADLEATQVRAPVAGRVLKVSARGGERVGETGLLELGDTRAMHAVAEVHEKDAPRVRVGQRATVIVQSLPGELTGEVVQVGWKVGRQVVFDNDPVKDTDARVVEVRVKLDSTSSLRVAALTYARSEVRIHTPEGR